MRNHILFVILMGVFLLQGAFASLTITEYTTTPPRPILQDMNEVKFTVTLHNSDSNNITYDFNAYINNQLLHSEKEVINAGANKLINFSWTSNVLPIEKGRYHFDFNVWQDNNNQNKDSKSFDLNVFKGRDLTILSLTSDKMNYAPGATAEMHGIIVNKGDLVASNDFNSCYFLNGVKKQCVRILSLDIDQYYNFDANITLPSTPQLNNITLKVDAGNEVAEFNESDNNKTLQVSTESAVDLSIIADDISYDKAIAKEKMKITAKIKNLGSKDATNVDVKMFIGENESSGNLIYYNTFASIPANSEKVVTAYWTPGAPGYNVINVVIDPDDKIKEKNKLNNSAKRGFYISPAPAPSQPKSYTFLLQTQTTCLALLSNNDRIVMDGITTIDGKSAVKLRVYDADGTERVNKAVITDEEITLPGRTIRVLDAEKAFARLLLVYQEPVTLIYNSCQLSLQHEYQRSQTYKQERDKCMQDKADIQAKLNACTTEKASILSKQTNYQKLYETCLIAKENLSNTLISSDYNCKVRIHEAVAQAEDMKAKELQPLIIQAQSNNKILQAQLDALKQKEASLENIIFFAQVGFAVVLFTIAGILVYTHFKWEGKIGD